MLVTDLCRSLCPQQHIDPGICARQLVCQNKSDSKNLSQFHQTENVPSLGEVSISGISGGGLSPGLSGELM